jgi:methyl-accepting chemotaxis protein
LRPDEPSPTSVASITTVIREVSVDAGAAVEAVSRSQEVVVDGTRRSVDATAALEAILTDTTGATERLEEIAVLTAEQLKVGVAKHLVALFRLGLLLAAVAAQ